eukprot:TRINITY_DN4449_c0_g1_i3.p1 TRINITY_DN4449_c0_g1~~TRINITY_DN4449_c0_g1_i3.p1  ORF type:complete len:575 (-),score=136.80 TRINITY_DN4449_c0_g1_i3:282-2006(-)
MLSAVELLPSEDLVDEEVKLEVVKRRQMLLDRLRAPEPILAGSVRAGDHDGTKTVPTTTTTTSNNNGNNTLAVATTTSKNNNTSPRLESCKTDAATADDLSNDKQHVTTDGIIVSQTAFDAYIKHSNVKEDRIVQQQKERRERLSKLSKDQDAKDHARRVEEATVKQQQIAKAKKLQRQQQEKGGESLVSGSTSITSPLIPPLQRAPMSGAGIGNNSNATKPAAAVNVVVPTTVDDEHRKNREKELKVLFYVQDVERTGLISVKAFMEIYRRADGVIADDNPERVYRELQAAGVHIKRRTARTTDNEAVGGGWDASTRRMVPSPKHGINTTTSSSLPAPPQLSLRELLEEQKRSAQQPNNNNNNLQQQLSSVTQHPNQLNTTQKMAGQIVDPLAPLRPSSGGGAGLLERCSSTGPSRGDLTSRGGSGPPPLSSAVSSSLPMFSRPSLESRPSFLGGSTSSTVDNPATLGPEKLPRMSHPDTPQPSPVPTSGGEGGTTHPSSSFSAGPVLMPQSTHSLPPRISTQHNNSLVVPDDAANDPYQLLATTTTGDFTDDSNTMMSFSQFFEVITRLQRT